MVGLSAEVWRGRKLCSFGGLRVDGTIVAETQGYSGYCGKKNMLVASEAAIISSAVKESGNGRTKRDERVIEVDDKILWDQNG